MGLVTFFGAKGSPGVTTTALLAAALWPRPAVLVDADPDGGDVALRLPRADGGALDRSLGLLTLLPLARRELAAHVVREHSQTVLGGVEVVAGLAGPEQVNAVGPLWGSLAGALHSLSDADVVVDAGRLHSQSVHLPLAQASDLVVCVLRLSVSGVVHARERLRTLDGVLVGASGRRPRVGVVVVAPPRAERDVLQVASGIQNLVPSVEMLGHLADDTAGAALFSGEPVSRPERTLLVRSGRRVVGTIASSLPAAVAPVVPPPAPQPQGRQAHDQLPTPSGEHEPLRVDARSDDPPTRRSLRRNGRRGGQR